MSPGAAWKLTKHSVLAFIDDGALSKGAAIAFYAVTSVGPALLIIVAVAGLVYGEDAARGALLDQLRGTMGTESAGYLQTAISSAGSHGAGVVATIIGIVSLILTASGVFGETQTALNAIWRAEPRRSTAWRLVRARLVSLGLVVALGLLLVVSLVLSAIVAAVNGMVGQFLPFSGFLVEAANFLLSLVLLAVVIGAIYKILPDCDIDWRDALAGSLVTAFLITLGKLAIGLYIGHSAALSSYGAAGSVLAALFWIYYSAQIFLLGAEFTRIYSEHQSTFRRSPGGSALPSGQGSAAPDRLSRPAG